MLRQDCGKQLFLGHLIEILAVKNKFPVFISLDDFLAEARKKVAEAKEKPSRMTRKTLDRLQKVVNGERKYYPRIEIKCKLSYYKR